MQQRIATPHDRFFRQVFGQPEIAADFLAHYLPAPIAAHLDLSSVAPQPETFIDPDLGEYHSDLLLRVGLRDGGQAWIYILIEHKIYEDRLVTVQLLRYLVRVWDRDTRDRASHARTGRTAADAIDSDDAAAANDASDTEGRAPRQVIPILLYHGQQPWKAPTRLGELFEGPEELRPYWPELQVMVVDLTAIPEEAIVGQVHLRVVLLVMRAIRSPDLGQRLPVYLSLLRDVVEQTTAMGTLQVVLRYVAHSSAVITEAELRQAVDAALPESGDESMTTLVEQWLEQGRQEGLHQGLHEAIELGLTQRFGDAGHDVTALAARIRAVADGDALRDILRTVWVAASLDEVRQALE